MSESDDTDVLLLLPPDLFLVPSSSDSDLSSKSCEKLSHTTGRNGVISELVGHMQSLETRIFAIESKDNSTDAILLNNSLDSQIQGDVHPRHTLPRTRFSVSQCSSLQNTPVKVRKSLSVPSTPSGCSAPNHANSLQNDVRSGHRFLAAADTNAFCTNDRSRDKHDNLTQYPESFVVPSASGGMGFPHAASASCKGEPRSCRSMDYHKNESNVNSIPSGQSHSMPFASNLPSLALRRHPSLSKTVGEMELSEVNELLQEMEATELELSKRINNTGAYQYLKEQTNVASPKQSVDNFKNGEQENIRDHSVGRRLNYSSYSKEVQCSDNLPAAFPDISLPYNDSYQLDETDKMISEFRTWEQSVQHPLMKSGNRKMDNKSDVRYAQNLPERTVTKAIEEKPKELTIDQNTPCRTEIGTTNAQSVQSNVLCKDTDNAPPVNEGIKYNAGNATKYIGNAIYGAPLASEVYRMQQQNGNVQHVREVHDIPPVKYITDATTNTDLHPRKTQRFLSLSDFWENNTNKSQEEMLRIKLEEEKFRREHCEHLIQELQKRLLEQQEKVAVALRVDNEKNVLISQFHNAWSKLKQRVQTLESEYESLQANLTKTAEKHQSEISEFQTQIKRSEGELSKALDLAAGYKEKGDATMKEKIELLKSHADELESYKSLVQEAEGRYEKMKWDYNKLLDKNQQTEEALKNLHQELGKERLRGGEVRNEMNIIHKALDTCEAELTVLRQEKESLQLKLREELNRNSILEHKNSALLSTIDDAKKAEKLARDETKSIAEEKEKIRSELQEVYQKQVDEVVKAKLQEFQTQLDTAESEFLEELKTRQQVIAECAARKIKAVMDKHRLEINLLEEKHKEEKRLCELQLAQVEQKSSMLETQLNSQRTTKSQLAEQLHSVMQKQWQQALKIISGGNAENLTPIQRINVEKFFEAKGPRKSESMPDCYTRISQEPMKVPCQVSEAKIRHGAMTRDDQNDSLITTTSMEETPLTSRKETKEDLRKYIRMIAEIQQPRDDFSKLRDRVSSPPLICREVPRKHYTKKELSIMSEDNVSWQPASEASAHDVSEYIPVPQTVSSRADQHKNKPPWK
ncbi:hypothetical protein KM043_010926 [Ampulex compressa]|nr:hypothetical protein KM043_010926 [Ampulex compressa]